MRCAVLAVLACLLWAAPAAAIVGGSETTQAWPHMVAMEFRDGATRPHAFRCGGSLVAPDVVLTAAHCVDADADGRGDTYPAGDFRFLVGSRDRESGGERIPAVAILEHPNYDATGQTDDDVALVRLERPAALGAPIRLAEDGDAPQWAPGRPATVIGWGVTEVVTPYDASLLGETSRTLREVAVTVRSDAECGLTNGVTVGFDADSYVCAGEVQGGRDACYGDSGGPLMVRDSGGAWIQIGVVSYGFECGYPSQYGVYTEVGSDPLRGWVKANAASMSGAGGSAPSSGTATTAPASGDALPSTTSTRAAPGLRLPSTLGSIRRARRRGAFLVRLRLPNPVTIRATLRQRGRTVARGTRRGLRTGTVRLRLVRRARLRPGRAVLGVVVVDARGRRLTARRTVTLRR